MGQEIALSTYAGVFLALMIGGETVLLPAVYLAASGALHLPLILMLSFAANILKDVVLYVLGTAIPPGSSSSRLLGKYKERIASLSTAFSLHALPILFMSKFVYGTRSTVQLLCGMYHVPFIKYLLVNMLAITILTAVYVFAAEGIYRGISLIDTNMYAFISAFVLFVLIAILFQILFKKYIWQKWFPQ